MAQRLVSLSLTKFAPTIVPHNPGIAQRVAPMIEAGALLAHRYLLVVEAHDDAKNGEDQRPQ